jgi:alkanesulfonate monooxygenase SsuD/methylene tetrahydromethanopterin reductase-like flavin-dependent oxidoreductase (luciferase family)
MDLGRVGIWHFLDLHPAAATQAVAREIEELGFKALWIPEALGREAFTHSALLLAGTKRLVVATGIANVWARDAMAMASAQKTLAEAYPDRFLLGMGVSHAPLVAGMRGHDYDKPLTYLRDTSTRWTRRRSSPRSRPRRRRACSRRCTRRASSSRASARGDRIRTSCRRSTPRRPEDPRPGEAPRARADGLLREGPVGGARGRAPGDADVPGAAELRAEPEGARLDRTATSRTAAATSSSTRSSHGAASTPSSRA